MAFKGSQIRLPDEYWEYLDDLAKHHGSRGYAIQMLLYGSGNGRLPPPQKRDTKDNKPEDSSEE